MRSLKSLYEKAFNTLNLNLTTHCNEAKRKRKFSLCMVVEERTHKTTTTDNQTTTIQTKIEKCTRKRSLDDKEQAPKYLRGIMPPVPLRCRVLGKRPRMKPLFPMRQETESLGCAKC